jgi:hypothetical protein
MECIGLSICLSPICVLSSRVLQGQLLEVQVFQILDVYGFLFPFFSFIRRLVSPQANMTRSMHFPF